MAGGGGGIEGQSGGPRSADALRDKKGRKEGGGQSRDQSPFPTFSLFVFSLLPWVAEMDKGGRHKSFFFVPPKKLFPVREFFENLPKKAQILTISLLFLTFRVYTNLVGVNTALNT